MSFESLVNTEGSKTSGATSVRIFCLRVLLIQKEVKPQLIPVITGSGLRVLLIQKEVKLCHPEMTRLHSLRVLLIQKEVKRQTGL